MGTETPGIGAERFFSHSLAHCIVTAAFVFSLVFFLGVRANIGWVWFRHRRDSIGSPVDDWIGREGGTL